MEQKQEQQNGNNSKRNERKGGSLKMFGGTSINGDDASSLVGSIIEKGIVSSNNDISKPIKPPQPSVLPFPVARHRSYGPHWTPRSNRNIDEEDEVDDKDESGFASFDPRSIFAEPVQRKEKKGLDLNLWKELMQSDDSSKSKGRETNKSRLGKTESQRMDGGAMKTVGKKSTLSDSLGAHADVVVSMQVDAESHLNGHRPLTKTEEAMRSESSVSSVSEMDLDDSLQLYLQENVKDANSDNFSRESRLMAIDGQVGAKRMFHNDSTNVQFGRTEKIDHAQTMVPKQFHNFGNEQGSMSLESEIDAENRTRLENMSSEEIAQAQAEIMEKMDPALLNLLKKRGQEKLKKQKGASSSLVANIERDITSENQSSNAIKSPNTESSNSQMVTTSSNITKSGLDNGLGQNLGPMNGSLWNAWRQRVEAVRNLRFSLDGTVVENDFFQIPETSGDNVAERDILRTEGDPGAAGYTIKEAVALSRSTIPGQRALALHLLASVLYKALHNIYLNPVGSTLANNNKVDNAVDWEAVWAFALGPEPELILSLRMSLDDNHNSVVLASAKVIQCILSCDLNENFFDFLEKTSIDAKDTYTAPIFRSKPEIDVGFLHGGYWKYSAKPSNILLYGDDIVEDETQGKQTIQDDIVVAGQDFTAGLVRMGVLPRIRYLLEIEPAAPLEECMISILIAIARHSPMCANAIMKCQRLVQTVVHRFAANNNVEVYPSKIKSVCLLKVLAQSDRKNCAQFIENGIFQAMTWHLYQNAYSLEQWLKLGRENCKLSSALMVEQLRFWKVCIQNGYCVSYFSNIFPALCLWLNPPTIEKLVENNVLSEYASVSEEAYLVLESLARTLPNFYSQKCLSDRIPKGADDDVETWSWSHVGPMVDLAMKWISFKSSLIDSQNGMKGNSLFCDKSFSPLLWVYSAVMHMLSRVLGRVIPEDTISLQEDGGHMPWLPDFVPKVGLEIIRNGFLSFKCVNSAEYGTNWAGCSSFIEQLCSSRQQSEFETSLASVCCLHGFFQVFIFINNLIQLAKAGICNPSQVRRFSQEENILARGILMESLFELRCVFSIFSKCVASEWYFMQSVEIFGRGGPAPGVGLGWGSSGGGFWSKTNLLAQTDARLLSQLLEIFQIVSIEVLPLTEERTFTMQMIHSALELCLIAGPRDKVIVEKALDVMLQVPMFKFLDLCIQRFIQGNGRMKLYGWEYKEDDYMLLGKALASHFRNRWLSNKKKLKALSGDRTSKGRVSLETIPEDTDTSNMMCQDHSSTLLVTEWAHQRLPLPMHWFLSPISTLCDSKHAGLGRVSDIQNFMQDPSDTLEVVKAGMFFLLGLEAMSTFISKDVASPVQSVPLIWKLHSLSIILLIGMAVLEEEKSRDVYESLQEIFGQLLDKTRSKRRPETILNMSINLLPETGKKYDGEFLRFQTEIHESYSTFIDTLVEQYAAVSFGDLIYGRQVAVYLHRCVEAPVRLAAWNALSNSRVLELLPPLQKCLGEAEGYLEPVEENEGILEAYAKSWVSCALDRAATRGSIAFTLVLHHLSSFVFNSHKSEKLLLRNKLVKSLLRDYSRKKQHEGMMLEFIQNTKPSAILLAEKREGLSLQRSNVEERLEILKEACEGNPSLLKEVEKLKVLL
ncbi:PREDICTED: transcriptional elongation regulator MINIYO [Theobroma cacao]|uniref:Transcriptional elongation regulator MINIYO n=1 Tax=Theobroma cacao TaxID=3641 RepID=A0AB32VGZ2_THECC|nr:PREDICTED: transcriptional elongation regulator MINIYO [Theobroma cacao]